MKKWISFILCFLLSACSISNPNPVSSFEMHVLDVGQGLCVYIQCDGHSMLYDGGNRSSSSFVVSYLQKQNIDYFDYVIASHYDSDHISGLVGVLNVFEVDTIIDPNYETDTDIYSSFQSKIKGKQIHPSLHQTFSLGSSSFEIIGPKNYGNQDENDQSICIRITAGNNHILICGDASVQAEQEMLDENLESDVYVVSHHGSNSSSSQSFIDQINPKYAIISCQKNNSYGHPHQEVLNRLQGCELYRTDIQGTIDLICDGSSISFSQSPCNDFTPGNSFEVVNNPSDFIYICNENSKKIHKPDCKAVNQMKEDNKYYTKESKEDLIKRGYTPCDLCQP